MAGKKKDEPNEEVETDDEELVEAEEDIDDGPVEIPESDFEVSDFSIGDIGLATAKEESGTWKQDLERSVEGEDFGSWEEKNEEREENNFYQGDASEREHLAEDKTERGADFYTNGGKGTDLYSGDSGNYNARDDSGEFYDPRIGKRAETEEVRVAGKSKLEIGGLQSGFGRGTERDIREKRDDKKYTN